MDGSTKPRHTIDAERAGCMYLIDHQVGRADEDTAAVDAAPNDRHQLTVGPIWASEVSRGDAVEAFRPVGMWTR